MARILVVDDDAELLGFYGDILESEGHQVDRASDGEEGFTFAQKGGYDLILLDVNLPKRDGPTIIKDLQTGGTTSPNGKLCLLTNATEVTDDGEVASLGVQCLIKSSLTPDEFLAQVRSLLS